MLSDEFLGLVAHELRTPVAAIIGYHDLMSEGIFGTLEPRVAEGVDRMRSSADQILALVAGLAEAATNDPAQLHVEVQPEDPRELFNSVMETMASEAHGRSTSFEVRQLPRSDVFSTDSDRVQRALLLVLHALIKNTAGGTLQIDGELVDQALEVSVTGARIDPDRDMAPKNGPLAATSACALRLGMAAHTLLPIGGTLSLQGGNGDGSPAVLKVRIPESASRG